MRGWADTGGCAVPFLLPQPYLRKMPPSPRGDPAVLGDGVTKNSLPAWPDLHVELS